VNNGNVAAKNCYLCGSGDLTMVYALQEFSVVRCRRCNLTFTLLPDQHAAHQNNAECYGAEHWGRTYFRAKKKLGRRYSHLVQLIGTYKQTGRLLDVGCSLGFFLETAREYGFDAHGVEPVKSAAAFAREVLNLKVTAGTLEQAKFADDFFDIVCLFDVLEHIPDPLAVLKEITRILKNDGLLVLQCPNIESTMANLTQQHWRWLLVPQHIYHFSRGTISDLLHKAGFHMLSWSAYDDEQEFAGNLVETRLRRVIPWPSMRHLRLLITCALLPAARLIIRRRYSKEQQTTGGVMLVFAAPRTPFS